MGKKRRSFPGQKQHLVPMRADLLVVVLLLTCIVGALIYKEQHCAAVGLAATIAFVAERIVRKDTTYYLNAPDKEKRE